MLDVTAKVSAGLLEVIKSWHGLTNTIFPVPGGSPGKIEILARRLQEEPFDVAAELQTQLIQLIELARDLPEFRDDVRELLEESRRAIDVSNLIAYACETEKANSNYDGRLMLGRSIRDRIWKARDKFQERLEKMSVRLSMWLPKTTGNQPVPASKSRTSDSRSAPVAINSATPSIRTCWQKALAQYTAAADNAAATGHELKTDRDHYDWFLDNLADDEEKLPSFETWSRYIGKARQLLDCHKNTPQNGRESRSVVPANRIESDKR